MLFSQKFPGSAAVLFRPATRRDFALPFTDTLERIKSDVCSLVHEFEGGIKIHNYAMADFTVILDEKCRLWLASYRGGSDYFMGDLFDEFIGTPHGHKDKIETVMEGIWRKRLSSEAIVTL